jgi:hypothetical protein
MEPETIGDAMFKKLGNIVAKHHKKLILAWSV